MQKKENPVKTEVQLWLAFTCIGVLVGAVAFLLQITEEYITEVKIFVT